MKATTLLERQHRNLQQLCEAVERGSATVRESLLPQLAGDLMAHLAVEDQLFYPAVLEVFGEGGFTGESQVRQRREHATKSIEHALGATVEGEEFERAIVELRAVIELHAQEEEETLFPRVERALEADASRQLARAMMSLYHAKVEAGYSRESREPAAISLGQGETAAP
jgi:hemerythrin superfamily protein